ncbi:hypothetical protein F751_4790 [Auxenochlorella protothecoides]|uniref:Uncharacterized protein n=1 Tax=Auxenochlorella protothecoides TaxID=3075 RepID=A0A087SKP3_AUXPR|nr:hypothetical protein F751_4790 [Auxenochlorella protothecoides]KFM26297.1 hypothetical protein F751_4790 [Auxenochlorella protothecoides]
MLVTGKGHVLQCCDGRRVLLDLPLAPPISGTPATNLEEGCEQSGAPLLGPDVAGQDLHDPAEHVDEDGPGPRIWHTGAERHRPCPGGEADAQAPAQAGKGIQDGVVGSIQGGDDEGPVE